MIVAYPRGTRRGRGKPGGYAMITPRTWKVFVVIVAYRHGMRLDRDVPARYVRHNHAAHRDSTLLDYVECIRRVRGVIMSYG